METKIGADIWATEDVTYNIFGKGQISKTSLNKKVWVEIKNGKVIKSNEDNGKFNIHGFRPFNRKGIARYLIHDENAKAVTVHSDEIKSKEDAEKIFPNFAVEEELVIKIH